MSWQERDYATNEGYRQAVGRRVRIIPSGLSLSTLLIIINVVVYVLDSMTRTVQPMGIYDGSVAGEWGPLLDFGCMFTPRVIYNGQIWRLITSQYLHGGVWHLFLNMLALYFLGRYLEVHWGRKRFFVFYTLCGVAGNLFFLLMNVIGWLSIGPAIGASGCILGVLGACAVLFPGIQLIVYFFPMRIRTAAALFLGLYVLNLINRGHNAGGDAAHLAGLLAGAVYAYWIRGASRPIFGNIRRVKYKLRNRTRPGAWERKLEGERDVEAQLDEILSKIKDQGIASLSAREREFLSEASRRQQDEEQEYGRTDRL